MTAAGLVLHLRARGVTLIADGETLRCRPKSALSDTDIAALKLLKPEILVRLRPLKPSEPKVPTTCFACENRRFWVSVHGFAICAVCHPPADNTLVVRWFMSETEDGAA